MLTAFDVGTIQFAYTAEVNQCAGTANGEILVIDPDAEINIAGNLLISNSSIGVFQWLDCENNFKPLPGENNDTLKVTASGSYALVNGAGDCIDTSACVLVALTGIETNETDQQIRIFPNPVSSTLFINGLDDLPVKEISIRNAVGSTVYTQRDVDSSASIDLTACVPGLYFLELSLENGVNYVFRVVKI